MNRILFITLNDHVPWGGSEELWSQTALKLVNQVSVDVLVKKWSTDPGRINELRKNGVNVNYKKNSGSSHPLRGYLDKLILKRFGKRVYHVLDNIPVINNYSLVVISVGSNTDSKLITFTNYLKKNAVPFVIIVQLASDLKVLNDNLRKRLLIAYNLTKTVYFLSEENIEKTEILLGGKIKSKALANNPFNFNQSYVPYEEPEDKCFTLACVAALTSFHKAQDLLIAVLGQGKWKKRNFKLSLYGDGQNKNQLTRLIEHYDLHEKVFLMGVEENKEKIWKRNVACIMPSRMEGQSLAMLEAMSMGRMVIATKVGDAERLIIDGETGYLIKAPTIECIDNTLENAWLKRSQCVAMGKASRLHLYSTIQKDPIDDMIEQLTELLK